MTNTNIRASILCIPKSDLPSPSINRDYVSPMSANPVAPPYDLLVRDALHDMCKPLLRIRAYDVSIDPRIESWNSLGLRHTFRKSQWWSAIMEFERRGLAKDCLETFKGRFPKPKRCGQFIDGHRDKGKRVIEILRCPWSPFS